jgi:hypothetical protein
MYSDVMLPEAADSYAIVGHRKIRSVVSFEIFFIGG